MAFVSGAFWLYLGVMEFIGDGSYSLFGLIYSVMALAVGYATIGEFRKRWM
jgi:drug/metabolite transporter (DMT)-like permease